MFRKFLIWLCLRLRIRFLVSQFPHRIGHLALEPVCFAKENTLGLAKWTLGIFPIPAEPGINAALVDSLKQAWRHGLILSTHPWFNRWANQLAEDERLRIDMSVYSVAMGDTATYYRIERLWKEAGRVPVLRLNRGEEARGRRELDRLGVPEGAWFVCIHCRSAGYSPSDDNVQYYRNSPISSFVPAMKAIVAQGGWCIRMGDPAMETLEPIAGVIDYAHSEYKNPFMDVYLCATCRFFLGNTSGLILVANAYGRPLAWTNLTPFSAYATPGTIGISKLIHSETLNRTLSFPEIMGTEIAGYRLSLEYEGADLKLIDNTAEEIEELAHEALAHVRDEDFEQTPEDEAMQEKMRSLLKPGHYSYGTDGRFGRDFLRRHRALIEGGDAEATRLESMLVNTKEKNWTKLNYALAQRDKKVENLRQKIVMLKDRLGGFRRMRDLVDAVAARHEGIRTVIDVGAAAGTWTTMCRNFIPKADYLLFEANPVHREKLEAFEAANQNIACVFEAAGPERGMVHFDVSRNFHGKAAFEPFPEDDLEVPMSSLDTEVQERGKKGPFLVKLGTNGFEVPILDGAEHLLTETAAVIMECYNSPIAANSLTFDEMCGLMRERGFRCVDATSPQLVEGESEKFSIHLLFEKA